MDEVELLAVRRQQERVDAAALRKEQRSKIKDKNINSYQTVPQTVSKLIVFEDKNFAALPLLKPLVLPIIMVRKSS